MSPAIERVVRGLLLVLLAGVMLPALPACGPEDPIVPEEAQAVTTLVSPMSPLGLNYGEPATLVLRYRVRGQPQPGVTLRISTDGDPGGATLSAASVVTNDRGEASVLLTAGAAEVAFHVVVGAPAATDLLIDVAVSRYAFGSLGVSLDGTAVAGLDPSLATAVRAALVMGTSCAGLPPTPKLGPVLRAQRAAGRRAVLTFGTLLVHAYTVVGRVEDDTGRLLAYGCVDVPETLLRAGLMPVVEVPLSRVMPSPVGTFTVKSTLALTLPSDKVPPVWPQLSCPHGLGQTLLDATLVALPTTDRDVGVRIGLLRGALDRNSCRTVPMAMDGPDQSLQATLTATTQGQALAAIAADVAAIQQGGALTSRLVVRSVLQGPVVAAVCDHTLTEVSWQAGAARVTYPIESMAVAAVTDLVAPLVDAQLTLPEHPLTLRLPSLWRRAYTDLVAVPRGLTLTPAQLFQASVSGAKDGALVGCAAVESVLCNGVAAPCKGKLQAPCMTAVTALVDQLNTALSDGAKELDFSYGATLSLEDPDGTLKAQTLSKGVLSGRVELPAGDAILTGTATGTRVP